MNRIAIGQQGEAKIYRIDALPEGMTTKAPERDHSGAAIISHSERGHHHVIPGAEVMERTDNVPAGMVILYAIVKDPTCLKQNAADAHGTIPLDPGIYELRVSREYNPFTEQARRVAD